MPLYQEVKLSNIERLEKEQTDHVMQSLRINEAI